MPRFAVLRLAGVAGPKAPQALQSRQKCLAGRPGKQGCMYHI
jgi:hypothetical protein